MGTYNLPRNVKGEGRILFIFSTKALLYSLAGAVIGFPFYFILSLFNSHLIGVIIMGVLGLIGFSMGTFKIPNTTAFDITKKTGGENIDDVIIRWFKFKMAKNKIYVYKDSEKKKELEKREGAKEK